MKTQENKEAKNLHKKRPLLMGSLMVYQIKCFLVSTFSVKPLLHTFIRYVIKFFCVEWLNGMLLNCYMCQFPIYIHKKTPLEKTFYLSVINMFGKFLILKLTEERYKVSTRLITNSFSQNR